jgi:hypothetical protein
LLRSSGRERGEATDEEVKTREWNKVYRELTKIRVELPWEAQRARRARHDHRHQVVQVARRRSRQLERPETDVVQSHIVNAENLIGGLNELVNGQSAVVGLDNGLRYLRGRDNGIRRENAIRILFPELV